ncbi:GntR family transcriptional regulator [Acrocarpospora pleiomorpha]
MSGVFSPGDPLVEVALADRYKVSRTPIREALRKLQADGLVEQFARGYRVSQNSPQDILDLYDVRIALEQVAAQSAAERRTPYDLARLGRAHQALVDAVAAGDSVSASSACAHAFHADLWEATHNKTLISSLESLERRITAFSSSTLDSPGRGESIVAEHAGIIEAVAAGDAELAGTLAREHMARSRDIRLALYAEYAEGMPTRR